MIDDSEDKLRRNLVVFAAAILGTVILQPKLAHNGQLLGFIETKDVDPFRMWGVIAAILVYLIYRYWHAEARRKAWRHWTDYANAPANEMMQRLLSADIVRNRYEPDALRYIRGLPPPGPNMSDNKRRPVKDVTFHIGPHYSRVSERVGYSIDYETGAGETGQAAYEVSRWRNAWIYGRALGLTVIRTGSMGELALPFLLATAAGVICVVELWTRWPWVFVKFW